MKDLLQFLYLHNIFNENFRLMNKLLPILFILFLAACGPSKEAGRSQQQQAGTAVNTDAMQQKQLEGIDLFAKGRSPASWALEIDFDKAIRFKSLDGMNIIASSVRPVEHAEEKRTGISTTTSYGNMQIDILQQECVDEISGEKFNKKVSVQVNGKTYEGCGQFLHDAAIVGKWTLQQWNGKKLAAGDFAKGLPQLQFDVANNKLSGHDGCNQLFGEMELRGNFIMVKAIGSTKMACIKNNTDVQLIQKISNQTISYFFKDGMLHLYLPDDSIAVFTKA